LFIMGEGLPRGGKWKRLCRSRKGKKGEKENQNRGGEKSKHIQPSTRRKRPQRGRRQRNKEASGRTIWHQRFGEGETGWLCGWGERYQERKEVRPERNRRKRGAPTRAASALGGTGGRSAIRRKKYGILCLHGSTQWLHIRREGATREDDDWNSSGGTGEI